MRTATLAVALLQVLAACDRPSAVRAFRATERNQLVGGPGAIGEVDDFVLENDRIRLVVSAVGNSTGPGMFGGSIVDVDLRRKDVRFAGARGLDHFSEAFPMTNLIVPGFHEGDGNVGLDDMTIEVVSDGADDEPAILRVKGKGDSIIEALQAIRLVGVETDMSFETDYILEPGASYVRIRTRLNIDSSRRPRPEDDPADDTPMAPLQGPQPLFDALLGDHLAPPDEQVELPGYLGGDFLLFGPKVSVFAPGEGYAVGLRFQQRFDDNEDLLNEPFSAPWLAATGDHVSYAYFGQGDLSIPIFTSSFTGAFTNLYQCRIGEGEDECRAGYEEGRLVYERYLSVGDGDVASAIAPVFDLRGTAHGRIEGHVLDGATGRPVSGADVFVVREPEGDFSGALGAIARNRAEIGDAGVRLEARTDASADARPEGAFHGRVEPGRYLLIAHRSGHPFSAPVPFTLEAGQTRTLTVVLPAPGRLVVSVTDERGIDVPGKLTLVGPGPCDLDAPLGAAGPGALSTIREPALGDGELPDGIAAVQYLRPGRQVVEVPAGEWTAIVSRGLEFSIHRACVTITPDREAVLMATVVHEVDTTGWISADFHVHGAFSFDGIPTHPARVASAVGEGLDLVCATDHDYMSDLGPTVAALGLEDWVATMVGLETTTIETGHTIGFPLRFDETAPENGAFDWTRRDTCVADPSARGCLFGEDEIVLPLVPDEIFEALRGLGSLGRDRTVVTVPHPRDGFFGYFDQFGMDPFDLTVDPGGLAAFNPVLVPEAFSGRFDALELLNGKRHEMIRTPTIAEITEFQERVRPLVEAGAPASQILAVHEELAREVLTRSAAESVATQPSTAVAERGRSCAAHSDCRPDEKCSPTQELCVALACTPDEADDPELADRACIHHQGVVDDWFRLLNHGVRKTGLANSDTHKLFDVEVGLPRNWIDSPTDAPAEIRGADVAAAVRDGRATVGMGPFVELWVDDAPIGSTVRSDGPVSVRVRVQTASWFAVDRVEIYRSGELWIEREIQVDPTELVDFDETIEDEAESDAWYVAVALGRAHGLAPVYTSVIHPQLGFSQVAAVAFSGIDDDLIHSIVAETPTAPELTAVVPYGITNPVFVDTDGDGWTAPLPAPGWAGGGSSELPLTGRRLQDPFRFPPLDADETRVQRLNLLRRWIRQAMHIGH